MFGNHRNIVILAQTCTNTGDLDLLVASSCSSRRRNVEAEVKVKEPVVSNVPPTNETLSCFTSAVCFSMTFVRHSIKHERQVSGTVQMSKLKKITALFLIT